MSTLKKFGVLGIILLLAFSAYFMFAESNNEVKIEKTQETETGSFDSELYSFELEEMFPEIDVTNFDKLKTITLSRRMKSSSLFPPLAEEHFFDIVKVSLFKYSVNTTRIERGISFTSLGFMLGICALAFVSGRMLDLNGKPVSFAVLFLISAIAFWCILRWSIKPSIYMGQFMGIYFFVFLPIAIMTRELFVTFPIKKYMFVSLVAGISIYCFSFAYLLNYDDNYLINKSITFPVQELILFFGLVILIEHFPTIKEKFKNFKTQSTITA